MAIAVLLCSLAHPALLKSQEARQEKPDEVLRVKTELVQTDVLVLNKEGQFVEGLKPEDFQLRVDGRVRTISFLDRVSAGSASEEQKLAAARGRATTGAPRVTFDRGRSVFFYLDDFHMSSNSAARTREMLSAFVDREMGPDDEVGIITATGQLGFLEQLTTERSVLHRAIARFNSRNFQSTDFEPVPMSESEAVAIMQDDRRTLDYFVDQLLKDMGRRARGPTVPSKSRDQAETSVRARAKSIVDQSSSLSVGTLTGLDRLIRVSGTLPWRKTLFLVSDGFLINDHGNPALDLRRIADTAARTATVIYSIDARGLITGITEASRKMAFDIGRMPSRNVGEISATQAVLRTLALDSAGKAILNTNSPARDLKEALKETADYYLMAWRPDEKDLSEKRFQAIEVSIAGRTDLMVRVRHGFFLEPPATRPQISKKAVDKKQTEEKPLPAALHNLLPRSDLPLSLSVGYADLGQAAMLVTATVEVPIDALQLGNASIDETARLDLLGAVVDEHGKPLASFDQNLSVKPRELKQANARAVIYNHQFNLPAGLYQIRVALQEAKTGRIGTAMQWLEVPDLKSAQFSLSSLFVGDVDGSAVQSGKLSVNAAHRFPQASRLGFFVYINNAARNSTGSDVALQIQVFRDEQPVITKPLIKVETLSATSAQPIPYGEDLSLQDLPIGRYVLQITVIDRIARASAQQRSKFLIY
jgi:VWFA-related protein